MNTSNYPKECEIGGSTKTNSSYEDEWNVDTAGQ